MGFQLNKTRNKVHHTPIIIITADKGGGKTAFIKRIISYLAEYSIPHTGFFADGTWRDGERYTFILTLVPEYEKVPLCDRTTESWMPSGRFRYNPVALFKGSTAVERAMPGEIILVDEIGLQELQNRIWAETLDRALNKNQNPLVLTVRYRYLDNTMAKWNLHDAYIFDGTKYSWEKMWPGLVELFHSLQAGAFVS